MASSEKIEDGSESGGRRTRRQPKTRQTVQVAKELVALAKKVAVFKGVTVASYANEALSWSADRIVIEIAENGALGVRDRAESLDFSKVPKGTFNIDPAIATRINMLAGSCLTSAAKLVHPYLKAVVEGDAELAGIAPREPTIDADQGDVRQAVRVLFDSFGIVPIILPDDSLSHFDLRKGDFLLVKPQDRIVPGMPVVLSREEGGYDIRVVVQPGVGDEPSQLASVAKPIEAEEAMRLMKGTLQLAMKHATQSLVKGSDVIHPTLTPTPTPTPATGPAPKRQARMKKT